MVSCRPHRPTAPAHAQHAAVTFRCEQHRVLILVIGPVVWPDPSLSPGLKCPPCLAVLFSLTPPVPVLLQAGLAFLVSTFLQSSAPATTLGFFIFILGFIVQVRVSSAARLARLVPPCAAEGKPTRTFGLLSRHDVNDVTFLEWPGAECSQLLLFSADPLFLVQLVTAFGFPYSKSFAPWIRYLWSLFPPNLLAIGLQYLGDATASKVLLPNHVVMRLARIAS